MTSIKKILLVIFAILFFTGVAVGLLGAAICTIDNQDYQELQPELFAPDEIATVLHNAELHQIYVCYDLASYVNVYSEDGTFQWAVATPYLKSAYFELSDDRIIVYNWKDAYIYDSADGDFVEKKKSEDLALNYDCEIEYTDEFQDDLFYFDTYQVYKGKEDGSLITVVARPWWYWIFNFGVCWCVSCCGAVGGGILIFREERKD